MSLEIYGIENRGDPERERFVLRATSDCDLGKFAVFSAYTHPSGSVPASGRIPHAYWFPKRDIKKNDFVVLYSKAGSSSEKKAEDGTTSHFFYWHLAGSIWVAGRIPVVVSTPSWDYGNAIVDSKVLEA